MLSAVIAMTMGYPNVDGFMRSTRSQGKNMIQARQFQRDQLAADTAPSLVAFVDRFQGNRCNESSAATSVPTVSLFSDGFRTRFPATCINYAPLLTVGRGPSFAPRQMFLAMSRVVKTVLLHRLFPMSGVVASVGSQHLFSMQASPTEIIGVMRFSVGLMIRSKIEAYFLAVGLSVLAVIMEAAETLAIAGIIAVGRGTLRMHRVTSGVVQPDVHSVAAVSIIPDSGVR